MDVYPFAQDIASPFAGWGCNPQVFDAPARMIDEEVENDGLVWRARTFPCYLENAGVSKRVRVIPDAGFGCGYDVAVSKVENET
jgi:hypothetical protein